MKTTREEQIAHLAHVTELAMGLGSASELLMSKQLKELDVWNANHKPKEQIVFEQKAKMLWNRYAKSIKAMRACYMDVLEFMITDNEAADDVFSSILAKQDVSICFMMFWLNACAKATSEESTKVHQACWDTLWDLSRQNGHKVFSEEYIASCMSNIQVEKQQADEDAKTLPTT